MEYNEQRAYFAAHAPEVPDWFRVEVPSGKPEIPRADKCLSRGAYNAFCRTGLAANHERKEIDAYNEMFCAATKKLEQWTVNNELRRLTAWRWTYADAMMAGFGK